MARDRCLNLYLPAHLRADHRAGKTNILSRLSAALPDWQLIDRDEAEGVAPPHGGFALTHMQEPLGPDTLCLRRAYYYPFWRIEPTNARWDFAVARAKPALAAVPPGPARAFHRRMQARIFGQADPALTRQDFVFMPLQGRLLQHRTFQSMSPLAMIGATLAQMPELEIRATLHPRESYSAEERAALAEVAAAEPRFRLVEAAATDLIRICAFVVCQNSSVALQAMIAGKGAVLFAGIDFHHPAGSVPRDGLAAAFAKGQQPPAQMARYLWWFFREQAIDAQRPEAEADIRRILAAQGWPVT